MKSHHQRYMLSSLHEIPSSALYVIIIISWNPIISVICYHHFMKSHHQRYMLSSLHEITSSALYVIITSWNHIISLIWYHHHFMKLHNQPYGYIIICYHHHFMKITSYSLWLYATIITSWKSHHRPYVDMSSSSLYENHISALCWYVIITLCYHHFMKITSSAIWLYATIKVQLIWPLAHTDMNVFPHLTQ